MPRLSERLRQIELMGETVSYRLVRTSRRSIGLRVDQGGLRVGAPHSASLTEIERLLRHHADWVLGKLSDWKTRQDIRPIRIADGTHLPWLDGELRLVVDAATRRAAWSGDHRQLTLAAGPGLAARLERALREAVRGVLSERVALWTPALGVGNPLVRLSSPRARWGSCSAKGVIRLNWRLGFLPLRLIDYVVIHELAHLKEMNHGPRFWSLVESLCPDWRQRRVEIRQRAPGLPLFEE